MVKTTQPRRIIFQMKLAPADAKRLDRLAKAAELTRSQFVRELLKKADKEEDRENR